MMSAGAQAAGSQLEYRLARDLRIVGRVLGLPVPGQGLVQSLEQHGMSALELLVRRDQAHEAAHPAFERRMQAEQADQLGRSGEPGRVSVELEIEIRRRAPDTIGQGLAGVADV